MTISVEKQPKCLALLQAEIPAGDAQKEKDSVIKAFSKEVRIPGFRPGKAPKAVIEKRHGEDIKNEVNQRLVNQIVQEALKQNEGLNILNLKNPDKAEFNEDGSYTFNATLILAPEFELPEYKGLEAEIPKSEISDEIITQNLEQLQQRFADYEEVEDRAIEANDLVVVDYTSTIDGKPMDEVAGEQAKPLASNEGYWIRIEEEAFFPGFTDALVGVTPGEEKEITVTLPSDFPLEVLRGQEAVFQVQVKEIKKEVLPELNDDFAAKIEPGKTLDEIKELIRADIEMRQKRQIEEIKVAGVLEKLTEKVEMEIAEEIIQSETGDQANRIAQQRAQAGTSREDIEADKEAIMTEAAQGAETNLKTNFILQEIAEKENLEVTQQEILQRITLMAKQAKEPVKKFTKQLQKNNQLNNIRQNMLLAKAVDFLVENATFTEVESPEQEDNNAE